MSLIAATTQRGATDARSLENFLPCAITLVAALGLAHLIVPDVVPVGYAEEPQASWAVLTAFLLRAIALTAAWVAIIALSLLAGTKLY